MTVVAAIAEAGWSCPGCGLVPVLRHPTETAAAVRSLIVRFGVLFRHADPDALVRCVDGPGSRSALDHACRVTYDLAALDHHLRTLLGEAEHRVPPDPAQLTANDTDQDKVVDALTRTGHQLARTIVGATDADWQRAATIGNRWVLDLLVLTLHDAGHDLHHAERASRAASAAAAR